MLTMGAGAMSAVQAADCVSGQNYDLSTTCTVPAGVTSISIAAWGGGGGGKQGDPFGPQAGAGGGGGSYCGASFTVSGGTALTLTIGSGGTQGSSRDGGATSVTGTGVSGLLANGGSGGLDFGGPGFGGSVDGCTAASATKWAGGTANGSGAGPDRPATGGGGSATAMANGTDATDFMGGMGEGRGGSGGDLMARSTASDGQAPGGGGGGGGSYSLMQNPLYVSPGFGADGRVVITFTAPPADGACGSANAATPLVTTAPSIPSELCSVGTPSSVTSGNNAYTWTCSGSNGGNDSGTCSAGRGYEVAAVAGANGSINPSTPQVLAYNGSTSFTVTPSNGYVIDSVTGCGGTLLGNTYSTASVTASCQVNASFKPAPPVTTTYQGSSPTGTGTVSAAIGCTGNNCGFDGTPTLTIAGQVGGTPPFGYTFPHGVLGFTTNALTVGSTVTVTITYPQALPEGSKFFKYGPATAGAQPSWYEHPASIASDRRSVTYSVTDGGQGDSNPADGIITDPAGLAAPAGSATAVPTLSEWAMMFLAGVVAMLGLGAARRRSATPLV